MGFRRAARHLASWGVLITVWALPLAALAWYEPSSLESVVLWGPDDEIRYAVVGEVCLTQPRSSGW